MPQVTRRRIAAPLPVAHFRVLIDGRELGLQSVSALQGIVDGASPADETAQTVVLRRAVSQDRSLFDWYRAAARGKAAERQLTIIQLVAPLGDAVNVWKLDRAVPVRWTGPTFDALSGALAMEELEVAYASLVWRRRY